MVGGMPGTAAPFRRGQLAGPDVIVGVAQPGRRHLQQNLTGTRRVELEFLHRPVPADVTDDRGAAPHRGIMRRM